MENHKKYRCCDPLNTECSNLIVHPIFIEYAYIWDATKQEYVDKPFYTCEKCIQKRKEQMLNR